MRNLKLTTLALSVLLMGSPDLRAETFGDNTLFNLACSSDSLGIQFNVDNRLDSTLGTIVPRGNSDFTASYKGIARYLRRGVSDKASQFAVIGEYSRNRGVRTLTISPIAPQLFDHFRTITVRDHDGKDNDILVSGRKDIIVENFEGEYEFKTDLFCKASSGSVGFDVQATALYSLLNSEEYEKAQEEDPYLVLSNPELLKISDRVFGSQHILAVQHSNGYQFISKSTLALIDISVVLRIGVNQVTTSVRSLRLLDIDKK